MQRKKKVRGGAGSARGPGPQWLCLPAQMSRFKTRRCETACFTRPRASAMRFLALRSVHVWVANY